MKAERTTHRIVPAKGAALFYTLFFALFTITFVQSLFHDTGSVKVNGREVYGEERTHVLLLMQLFLVIPVTGLILYGRRLLPGSPFDFLEIGPEGLTVGTLFGRRRRQWKEISAFSVGGIPLTNPPIIWIKVESEHPMRFLMGGYVRFKFFSFTKTRVAAIADWLDLVRRTYAFGDGALPPPPEELAGKIIPQAEDKARMQARSSVIER